MISIKVPATTANMGPGFDTLGMALQLYNIVEIEETDSNGINIQIFGLGEGILPTNQENIVYKAAEKVFQQVGIYPKKLNLRLTNNIPLCRGLGSSAAAIVGGLVAANKVTGEHLSMHDLLKIATSIEGHPDNVAPALLGGLTISCLENDDVVYLRLEPPKEIKAVVAIPDFHLSTEKARQALPKDVPLQDAVFNTSRAALLIAALTSGNLEILNFATQDRLHQSYRSSLIPGMDEVFKASREAGAKAVTISGAGPSILALATENTEEIAQAMKNAFSKHEIKSRVQVMDVCLNGCQALIKN